MTKNTKGNEAFRQVLEQWVAGAMNNALSLLHGSGRIDEPVIAIITDYDRHYGNKGSAPELVGVEKLAEELEVRIRQYILDNPTTFDQSEADYKRRDLIDRSSESIAVPQYHAKQQQMDIMNAVAQLADYTDIPPERLIGILRTNSTKPDIFPQAKPQAQESPRVQVKRGRPANPAATISRLLAQFKEAQQDFTKWPNGSRERGKAADTLVRSFKALRARNYPVAQLNAENTFLEAQRVARDFYRKGGAEQAAPV